ncbi:MAG TPA: hypothetical protein PL072_07645, partial [Phycisphaerales bacterium]|nr:hypothetical protein [Phycisphaerales bacterium]
QPGARRHNTKGTTMTTDRHPRTAFPAGLVPGSPEYYSEALRRVRLASADGFHDNDAASRVSEEDRRERDEAAFLRAWREGRE